MAPSANGLVSGEGLPNPLNTVTIELRIGAHQIQVLDKRLSHENAVKRVCMTIGWIGKISDSYNV